VPRSLIDLEMTYHTHTSQAIFVSDGVASVWLPLSQVELDKDLDRLSPGDPVEVTIPEWLADDKGLT